MRADGGARRLVVDRGDPGLGTPGPAEVSFGTWSPDGRTVAFTARFGPEEATRAEIWAAGVDGAGLRSLGEGSQPEWSPDGRLIARHQSRTLAGVAGVASSARFTSTAMPNPWAGFRNEFVRQVRLPTPGAFASRVADTVDRHVALHEHEVEGCHQRAVVPSYGPWVGGPAGSAGDADHRRAGRPGLRIGRRLDAQFTYQGRTVRAL